LFSFVDGFCLAQVRELKIAIVQGEGAFNNIERRLGRNIIVEVQDENGKPVAGADVTFVAPQMGASVTFEGASTMTRKTNEEGRAATSGLVPNGVEGRFEIRVLASHNGVRQSAVIAQSNTAAGGVVAPAGRKKKFVILGVVAGAAAGGLVFGLGRGGNGGSGGGGPGATSVSIGGISVGGPR
jgi:hypothetical protein